MKENNITNQTLKNEDFKEKSLIILRGKITASVGHVIMQMNAKIGKIISLRKLRVVYTILSLAKKKH